jgi:hypothetical protein
MTKQDLGNQVYYVVDGEVVESSYKDYLLEYGQDLTTSPNGISDRMHIREVKDDEDNVIEWQIWTWGVNGNHPAYTGTSFDNEEEADLYYYERCQWYISEKNWNAPCQYDSEEEAENGIIERMADNDSIDKEVAASIYRKSKIVKEAREIAAKIHPAKVTAEYEARKARLAIEVPAEAASLTIDEQFKAAVKWANEASGNEKSQRSASALKGLLERNGRTEITSDFWQVYRILKAQTEPKQ